MDLLSNHMNTRVYCDKIKDTKYQQSVSNTNTQILYPSFIELLFTNYDHHYSMVESSDKELYMKQRLLEIATQLEEQKDTYYDKYNYNKKMTISIIQHGLQSKDHLSSLLYLGDLYNVSMIVYLEGTKQKIKTTDKDRALLHIVYTSSRKWYMIDTVTDELSSFIDAPFDVLSMCVVLDVSTKDVYNRYLGAIGTYKSPELVELATQRNISLIKGSKKKVKKELYDDINYYELNNTH